MHYILITLISMIPVHLAPKFLQILLFSHILRICENLWILTLASGLDFHFNCFLIFWGWISSILNFLSIIYTPLKTTPHIEGTSFSYHGVYWIRVLLSWRTSIPIVLLPILLAEVHTKLIDHGIRHIIQGRVSWVPSRSSPLLGLILSFFTIVF